MEKRSKGTASIQNDTTTDDTADQATTAALAAQQVAFQSIVVGQLKAFSGKGAAVFAEGLSGAVASGLGKVRYLN